MAAPASLKKINPETVANVIILMAIALFGFTVIGVIAIADIKNSDLLNYELSIILQGNGHLLKDGSKREFAQRISLKNEEFYLDIVELNQKNEFHAGSLQTREKGQCASQKYFEFDVTFCRPKLIPWDFLKIISLCYGIIIFCSFMILKYLSSEMLFSFKRIFTVANIPYPKLLKFPLAWKIALEMAARFQDYQYEAIEVEKERAIISLSKQVAHDIRSPISVLNMVLGTDNEGFGKEKRKLINSSIKRINDIAEELLLNARLRSAVSDSFREEKLNLGEAEVSKEGRAFGYLTIDAPDELGALKDNKLTESGIEVTDLDEIVISLMAEKQQEFKNIEGVSIQLEIEENGLKSSISSIELSRLLSNLINNSVESILKSGFVKVSLRGSEGFNIITILDSGAGIPKELLKRIGQKGATFGKEKGNGLGLYYAKKSIEECGGKLEILSHEREGTLVTIRLPVA